MTQKETETPTLPESLVVTRLLWHGGRFLPEGAAFAVNRSVSAEVRVAQSYIDKGFVADAEKVAQGRNPEAFAARKDAQSSQAELAELQSLVGLARDDLQTKAAHIEKLEAELSTANARVKALEDAAASVKPIPTDALKRLTDIDGISPALAKQALSALTKAG